MYKVILVDDEPYVIEGLKLLVDWKALDFEIVGEASNGQDALELINALNPDLAIIDIRMPVMNGLELLQAVAGNIQLKTKFIIVSGYSDFAHIKFAMGMNVSAYIFKPLDDVEINSTLNEIKKDIELQAKKDIGSIQTNKAFTYDLLSKCLFSDSIVPNDVSRLNKLLFLGNTEGVVYLIIQMTLESDFDVTTHLVPKINDSQFQEIILKNTSIPFPYPLFNIAYGCHIVIIPNHVFKGMKNYLEQIRIEIESKFEEKTTILIGGEAENLSHLRDSYEQANHAMLFKFYHSSGCIIDYPDIKNITRNESILFDGTEALIKNIMNNDAKAVYFGIEEISRQVKKRYSTPEAVHAYLNGIEMELKSQMKNSGESRFQPFFFSLASSKELLDAGLAKVMDAFTIFCNMNMSILHTKLGTNNQVIVNVKEYIQKNFQSDINIISIATRININPDYLGKLFRKYTGMGLMEYLTNVRIETAKKMIVSTDIKISEIARNVGFNDFSYFANRFKKATGDLPSKYRSRIKYTV